MERTHQPCRCEVCITHPDTAVCGACQVTWPCDAAVGRAALEAIALQAEGWKAGAGGFGIERLIAASKALRTIRDEARTALGEQT